MASTTVFCRFQVSGFHRWPAPPQQYEYLGNLHRHVFHVEVHVPVNHDNRDVEFIHLKYQAEKAFRSLGLDAKPLPYDADGYSMNLGNRSCEMIAKDLYIKLRDTHGIHASKIVIAEDGENGATTEF